MKKIFLFTILILALTACVTNKANYEATNYLINDQGFIEIAPGYGLGDIHIGMQEAEALHILGTPFQSLPPSGERDAFEGVDYVDPTPFDIGFDYVYWWFDKDTHPVSKLYIKSGKVVMISFDSTLFDQSRLAIYKVKGTSLFFGSSIEEITAQLGQAETMREIHFEEKIDNGTNSNPVIARSWMYPSKGITVDSSQGAVSSIEIYAPR